MSTSQPRQLSKEGQQIFYKVNVGVTTLLSGIPKIYSGVTIKAQHVATQFPVTFQTTLAPRKLPFNLFSVILPPPTFEFPPLSLCGVSNITCSLVSNILTEKCVFTQIDNCAVFDSTLMTGPKDLLVVTPLLSSSYASITWNDTYIPIVQNTTTTIVINKLVKISLKNVVSTDYELFFFAVPTPSVTLAQFKYKNFQVTYEKSFYPLDMDNWFGEIGGVAALFYALWMGVLAVVMTSLKSQSRYSDSLYAKAANENFDQFN